MTRATGINSYGLFIDFHGLSAEIPRLRRYQTDAQRNLTAGCRHLVPPGNPHSVAWQKILLKSLGVDLNDAVDKDGIRSLVRGAVHPLLQLLDHFLAADNAFCQARLALQRHVGGFLTGEWIEHGTVTGRHSCRGFNLLAFPHALRQWIVPSSQGRILVVADYRAFELAVLAWISGDSDLLALVIGDSDPYQAIGKKLLPLAGVGLHRDQVKILVLALLYGMSVRTVSAKLAVDMKKANAVVSALIEAFPVAESYLAEVGTQAVKDRRIQAPFGGRIRRFSKTDRPEQVKRWARNHVVQAHAARIFTQVEKEVRKLLPRNHSAQLLLPVHDAFIVDCSSEEAYSLVQELSTWMQSIPRDTWGGMPLRVKIGSGRNWEEGESAKILQGVPVQSAAGTELAPAICSISEDSQSHRKPGNPLDVTSTSGLRRIQ